MKRRDFIRNMSIGGLGTITLAGYPVRLLTGNHALKAAAMASSNDNVLIFVQMHGGNDALNTLVPIDQYNTYYKNRANIAIPDYGSRKFINVDQSIPVQDQVGLHPDMKDFKTLYDEGKAVIVQNVGYPHMNMSHFRGRDIVFMGMDGNTADTAPDSSGWMGRFLDKEYPNYPTGYPSSSMPDPIAIELGEAMSIAFQRSNGIPIGLNVSSPQAFYDLINSVGSGIDYRKVSYAWPEGYAGDELKYLWQFEGMTDIYAGRLKQVYDAGKNSTVQYPEKYPHPAPSGFIDNPLSGQLRLIARLLDGGIKTRIFLCRIGGFDTHAAQVESYDPTLGEHAALLYHLASSIKAFQDDLASLNIEDKVLTMTFTEFGRRVHSNGSYGTDHGTATPVFLFGKALKPSIQGTNPDLNDLDNGNLKYTTDYRSIYSAVVKDWFGASDVAMQATRFSQFADNRIDLFGILNVDNAVLKLKQTKCYPNPATVSVNFQFMIEKPGSASITILNTLGQKVKHVVVDNLTYGVQTVPVSISDLKPGNYVYRIEGTKVIGMGQFIKN